MRRWLVAAVAALSIWNPAAGVAAQSDSTLPPGWSSLGPLGSDASISSVAVSPNWPADQTIVAARGGQGLIRTRDGGQHWDFVGTPATLAMLTLAPASGGPPLIFGVSSNHRIYRSSDLGGSWQAVLDVGGASAFVFSPAFAQDKTAFINAADYLWRSGDGGQTWTNLGASGVPRLSPNFAQDGIAFRNSGGILQRSADGGQTWMDAGVDANQYVVGVAVSPTFGTDGVVLAAVTTDDNDTAATSSDGVMRSTDAGQTWTQSATGLAVDDTPYLDVQQLVVSPTFTQDQTVFAWARGPKGDYGASLPTYGWGLFRSSDAGASWQAVWTGSGYPDRSLRVDVALSPSFATDGTMLRTEIGGLVVGRASGCSLQLSQDGGASWTDINVPSDFGTYWSCGGPALAHAGQSLVGSIGIGGQGGSGTGLWSIGTAGVNQVAPARQVTTRPVSASDGTVIVGSASLGILATGTTMPAAGPLSCPVQPTLGFGRVYTSSPEVRQSLGCAVDAEQSVRITESRYAQTSSLASWAYSVDSMPDAWFALFCDQSPCSEGQYVIHSVQSDAPPTGELRTYSGIVQPFERGWMLYTTEPDNQHQILALGGPAPSVDRLEYRAFADPT
ncbi:MAG: hypothetical protein JO020_05020 [Chloroflexi bacterium]|nr:hypothetical protein [Chloroflexota bacterium]